MVWDLSRIGDEQVRRGHVPCAGAAATKKKGGGEIRGSSESKRR